MENKCKNCKNWRRASDVLGSKGNEKAVFGSCKLSIGWAYYCMDGDIQQRFQGTKKETFGGESIATHENFGCINFEK